MSETTVEPSAPAEAAATAGLGAEMAAAEAEEVIEVNIRSLLEAGVHFGHQTRRWNPRMREFIFGERNGIHILDLDQSLPRMTEALDYIRDTTANGGRVLFVGTKRQAAPILMEHANRSKQFYVNNRWLGGMLTNWKTVKKSIDRYKELLEILGDEEKKNELSKKELARVNRLCDKYQKSLEGIKEMSRLPDVMFVIDVGRETIAVSEARRLGIPIVAIVDSNCNPDGIDFIVPGNDDSIRAITLYCRAVAQACMEGEATHQERLRAEPKADGGDAAATGASGRRVVEIRQSPRRGRGQQGQDGGSGRARTFGGRDEEAPQAAEADGAAAAVTPKAAEAPAAAPTPKAAPAAAPTPKAAPAAAPTPKAAEAPAAAPTETPKPEGGES